MILSKILFAILLPFFMTLVFTSIAKSNKKANKKMTDERFTMFFPRFYLAIGVMGAAVVLLLWIAFEFLQEEPLHILFYFIMGPIFLTGIYMILKVLTFKVEVDGNNITYYSALRKPYTFTFDDITSVLRQVRKHNTRLERLVIRTKSGRKIILECSEVGYKRISKRIKNEVKKECLSGF